MPCSSSVSAEKKRWWVSNRKVVEKYVKDARTLIATQDPSHASSALGILDAALSISPSSEAALELKARSLLYLRRFRDVADMLQGHIPSFRAWAVEADDSSTSLSSEGSNASSSSQKLSRERRKLLPPSLDGGDRRPDGAFRCLLVSDLKRKVLAGLLRRSEDDAGQWRYVVLGQACSHLGMMEDAMALLQAGRRLATAASRRDSHHLPDDDFSLSTFVTELSSISAAADSPGTTPSGVSNSPPAESEAVAHMLVHIKFLLRRRGAAAAALDAGLPAESVRHFSKILDGRRGVPHAFAVTCLVGRAAAYGASGRVVESITDCNRALALDPACIPALRARADLLESVRSLPDCLRDLDHLKLLYDAILRDGKLPGPPWRIHHSVHYRDIAGDLRKISSRIQELRRRVAMGEACNVDYYSLMGVRRGCTRSDLERANLLLSLKHQPDKAAAFVDRVEFADELRDIDAVREQARMSALVLYRLLQKGYACIMSSIMDQEAAEKQRLREAAAPQAAPEKPNAGREPVRATVQAPEKTKVEREPVGLVDTGREQKVLASVTSPAATASVFQGVLCRDLAAVGNLLTQVRFNQAIPVKYEALSC